MISDAWQSMTYGGAFLSGVAVGMALGMLLLGMAIFVAFKAPAALFRAGRYAWRGTQKLFLLEAGWIRGI